MVYRLRVQVHIPRGSNNRQPPSFIRKLNDASSGRVTHPLTPRQVAPAAEYMLAIPVHRALDILAAVGSVRGMTQGARIIERIHAMLRNPYAMVAGMNHTWAALGPGGGLGIRIGCAAQVVPLFAAAAGAYPALAELTPTAAPAIVPAAAPFAMPPPAPPAHGPAVPAPAAHVVAHPAAAAAAVLGGG